MLTMFISPSCTSCRKMKKWLKEHEMQFEVRNLFSEPLTEAELKQLLMLTENGTEDIISRRSKIFQRLSIDFDDLAMGQLLKIVHENPSILRRPMLTDGKRLLIGFNDEEIRMFLPRKLKQMEMRNVRLRAGML